MNCDKCNKEVNKRDSAIWLSYVAGEINSLGFLVYGDRHISCSPSRAQFIIGFDVNDNRPEYDKRLLSTEERVKLENFWTNAFNKLQEMDTNENPN